MLTVAGPRAERFIELLGRHSGLVLQNRDRVRVDTTLLGNPYCSQTLQTLVQNIIAADPATVHVTARGDVPGGVVDSFFSAPAVQIRSRTVFVRDLDAIEILAPELAAALIAHFLAEYFYAASQGTPRQFADAHVAGLVAEARVIRDLTGRPIFEGDQRPWDRTLATAGGRSIAERRYGPGNVYRITLGPAPAFPILAVSRSH
jgi:hypothetical protein